MNSHSKSGLLVLPVTVLAVAIGAISHAADSDSSNASDLAQFYGFTGLELFELNDRAGNLVAGDFTNDGLTDLLVVDNQESCLKLLRQRAAGEKATPRNSSHVNDLHSDRRFEFQEVAVDKQVAGLTSGDFNNDGRLDIAYIGMPDRLIIRYQTGEKSTLWNETWSTRLPGLAPVPWMVSSGDLNGDGCDDIVVLGKSVTYLIYQDDEGKIKAPDRLINTSTQLSLLQAGDLNGDDRDDVCYMANEGSDRGFCARLQTSDGRLGPEITFDLQKPRSVTVADVDGKPGREILTIDPRTGRLVVFRLESVAEQSADVTRRLVHFGISDGSSSGQDRALTIGDIDGDGLDDVIVTDPDNAQILVFRQNGVDGIEPAETFPGLLGANDARCVDVDGDGREEVILMSQAENVVALSRYENGRLTFPKPITRAQEDKSLTAIEVLQTGDASILTVCTEGKARSKKDRLRLYQMKLNADGTTKETDRAAEFDAKGVSGNRGLQMLAMDVNTDGREDLLIIPLGSGSDGIMTFLTEEDGLLAEEPHPSRLDMGKGAAGPVFVHGQQLLVGRGAFARAMKLDEERWTVADQFNATEQKARIAGAAAMDYDNDGADEIILVDTGIDRLRILRNDSGLYRPSQEVELTNLKYRSSFVADLNGDQADDLLLFGDQKLSVLYSGGIGVELHEVSTWESERDNAWAADVISGDINGDDATDLVVIDTGIDGIEILHVDSTNELEAATHFRVFEEKRLVSSAEARGTEPREGLIVDVTGDGKADLVLLCHDQLIVYPQDAGEVPPSE